MTDLDETLVKLRRAVALKMEQMLITAPAPAIMGTSALQRGSDTGVVPSAFERSAFAFPQIGEPLVVSQPQAPTHVPGESKPVWRELETQFDDAQILLPDQPDVPDHGVADPIDATAIVDAPSTMPSKVTGPSGWIGRLLSKIRGF